MFWHPLYLFAISSFNTLAAALPPWSLSLGSGYGGDGVAHGSDGGAIHDAFAATAYFDRFFPISDALAPVLGTIAVVTLGLNIIKFAKWVISLIPTISGAG